MDSHKLLDSDYDCDGPRNPAASKAAGAKTMPTPHLLTREDAEVNAHYDTHTSACLIETGEVEGWRKIDSNDGGQQRRVTRRATVAKYPAPVIPLSKPLRRPA